MQKLPLAQLHNYSAAFRPNRSKQLWRSALRGAGLFAMAAATVVAQEASTQADADSGLRGIPVTLAGQFFDHDFVNYTLFANAVYDTTSAGVRNSSSTSYGGFGWSVGGGVTASHVTRTSSLSLNYRGGYRHYGTANYGSGTDQNLAIDYSRRLTRRWSMGADVSGGILLYGGSFYSVVPNPSSTVVTNPLSSETRFLSSSLSFTYQQSRRLSYVFSGQFFLNNYNYAGAINSVGGSGAVSAVYRITGATSLAGTYSHTYYTYGDSGQSSIDSGSLTVSHNFPAHWQASLTAGVSRAHSSGTISIPVSIILGQQIVNGYVTGPYDQVSLVPSFQASLVHYLRRTSFSISAGQGVQPGNGVYLTSRTQFLNATYSRSARRSNFSVGGGYFRLTSIANSVSQAYNTANLSASYSYVVRRHLSADFRYDLISYGGLFNSGRSVENRFTVGISFSSQSIPLTLF
jgi:hypothetical protein